MRELMGFTRFLFALPLALFLLAGYMLVDFLEYLTDFFPFVRDTTVRLFRTAWTSRHKPFIRFSDFQRKTKR